MELSDLLSQLSGALYAPVCHQGTSALGFCWRCFGLHVGLTIGWWAPRLLRAAGSTPRTRQILAVAPVVMMMHWTLGIAGLIVPLDATRVLTGSLAGASLGMLAAQRYRARVGAHAACAPLPASRAALVAIGAALVECLAVVMLPGTALQAAASLALLSNFFALTRLVRLPCLRQVTGNNHGYPGSHPAA